MSDFGGLIQDAREKLGMSPHRVAELIGRASGTVRAWERGRTVPNDPLVVSSLAAVLAIDEAKLFEAAKLNPPDHRQALTIEQELATIAPARPVPSTPPSPSPDPASKDEDLETPRGGERTEPARPRRQSASEDPQRVTQSDSELTDSSPGLGNVSDFLEKGAELVAEAGAPFLARLRGTEEAPRSVRRKKERPPRPRAAMPARPPAVAPAPTPVTPAAPITSVKRPGPASGSYLDDPEERWSYRLRTLWTAAGVGALGVLLLWAGSRALEAFGDTWEALLAGL